MSTLEKLAQARAELEAHHEDPWLKKVEAAVRDTDAIRRLGFPVFCAAVHIRGTIKGRHGSMGQPIVLGGATVRTGDYIVADSDGIVVVRPGDAPATRSIDD